MRSARYFVESDVLMAATPSHHNVVVLTPWQHTGGSWHVHRACREPFGCII